MHSLRTHPADTRPYIRPHSSRSRDHSLDDRSDRSLAREPTMEHLTSPNCIRHATRVVLLVDAILEHTEAEQPTAIFERHLLRPSMIVSSIDVGGFEVHRWTIATLQAMTSAHVNLI